MSEGRGFRPDNGRKNLDACATQMHQMLSEWFSDSLRSFMCCYDTSKRRNQMSCVNGKSIFCVRQSLNKPQKGRSVIISHCTPYVQPFTWSEFVSNFHEEEEEEAERGRAKERVEVLRDNINGHLFSFILWTVLVSFSPFALSHVRFSREQ